LEALDEEGVVPVVVLFAVCAKAADVVVVKLTILAIATSSMADRMVVIIVFLDIIVHRDAPLYL
jgi:hypothetical protein